MIVKRNKETLIQKTIFLVLFFTVICESLSINFLFYIKEREGKYKFHATQTFLLYKNKLKFIFFKNLLGYSKMHRYLFWDRESKKKTIISGK